MIGRKAKILLNPKVSAYLKAVNLFELQCWAYGGDQLARAGRCYATLRLLEIVRRKELKNRNEILLKLAKCFPINFSGDPLACHAVQFDLAATCEFYAEIAALAEFVIDFSLRYRHQISESSPGQTPGQRPKHQGGSTMARYIVCTSDEYRTKLPRPRRIDSRKGTPESTQSRKPHTKGYSKTTAQNYWNLFSDRAALVYLMRRTPGFDIDRKLGVENSAKLVKDRDRLLKFFCTYNEIVSRLSHANYQYASIDGIDSCEPFTLSLLPFSVKTTALFKNYSPIDQY